MSYRNRKYPWGPTAVVLLFTLFLFGCAGKTIEKDPFFEKWGTMAETNTGSSPVAMDRSISMVQKLIQGSGETGEDLKTTTIRELPTQQISLKCPKRAAKPVCAPVPQ